MINKLVLKRSNVVECSYSSLEMGMELSQRFIKTCRCSLEGPCRGAAIQHPNFFYRELKKIFQSS